MIDFGKECLPSSEIMDSQMKSGINKEIDYFTNNKVMLKLMIHKINKKWRRKLKSEIILKQSGKCNDR